MSLREIVRWPDPVLRTVCVPVGAVTDAVRALAEDMLETMYAAPGRGLAAPQVGVTQRVFVMDTEWKEGAPAPMIFVDPEIFSRSDTCVTRTEGCLSIPGISTDVARPDQVILRWTDLSGQVREQGFEGFAAACVQHELDHLDGIVTLDRLDPEARAKAIKAYEEVAA
jgi:peptide deformylase